jgi:hypothetical protein
MLASIVTLVCGSKRFTFALDGWQSLEDLLILASERCRFLSRPGIAKTGELIRECRVQAIKLEERHVSDSVARLRLETALAISRGFKCEDLRDKVFGVQALVLPTEGIPINYKLSTRAVFMQTYEKLTELVGPHSAATTVIGEDGLFDSMGMRDDPSVIEDMKAYYLQKETDPARIARVDNLFGMGGNGLAAQYASKGQIT